MDSLKIWNKARNLTGGKFKKRLRKLGGYTQQRLEDLETTLLLSELYIIKVCNDVHNNDHTDMYVLRFRNMDLLLLDYDKKIINIGKHFQVHDFDPVKIVENMNKLLPDGYRLSYDIAVRHKYLFDNRGVKSYMKDV